MVSISKIFQTYTTSVLDELSEIAAVPYYRWAQKNVQFNSDGTVEKISVNIIQKSFPRLYHNARRFGIIPVSAGISFPISFVMGVNAITSSVPSPKLFDEFIQVFAASGFVLFTGTVVGGVSASLSYEYLARRGLKRLAEQDKMTNTLPFAQYGLLKLDYYKFRH